MSERSKPELETSDNSLYDDTLGYDLPIHLGVAIKLEKLYSTYSFKSTVLLREWYSIPIQHEVKIIDVERRNAGRYLPCRDRR